MKLQDHMIKVTAASAKNVFKAARAVPQDKLEWKPLDLGRSVLDLCRELAMCPDWAAGIIQAEAAPEFNEESMNEAQKVMSTWSSVDQCESECNKRLENLFEIFRNMPDERLSETKWLPYDGGRDFTMPEMMDYPRWNFDYHEGQINYIQTLYGDKEMH